MTVKEIKRILNNARYSAKLLEQFATKATNDDYNWVSDTCDHIGDLIIVCEGLLDNTNIVW